MLCSIWNNALLSSRVTAYHGEHKVQLRSPISGVRVKGISLVRAVRESLVAGPRRKSSAARSACVHCACSVRVRAGRCKSVLEWLSLREASTSTPCCHIQSPNINIQRSNHLGRCRRCCLCTAVYARAQSISAGVRAVRRECVLRVPWHVGRFARCHVAK